MERIHSSRAGSERFLRIDDPTQAKLLTDPISVGYLSPFLARERTVGQAAAEIGCGIGTMYYRVGVFLQAGLLEVRRVEPRAGRSIKHYRSVADGFFIPFEATPYAGLEERLEAQRREIDQRYVEAVARLLREAGVEGQRLYRGPDGEVWQEAAADVNRVIDLDSPDAPAALDFFREVRLTRNEARALQRELLSYRDRHPEEERAGRPYLFQVFLVPEA